MIEEIILEKWKELIKACKNYYVDSIPTGMDDSTYDQLEKRAIEEDGFFVRDYVFQTYLKGAKTKNSRIEKIKKTKVEDTSMLDAIRAKGANYYYDLKYDGSSLAIYLDSQTGIPKRVVTVGNLNLSSEGVDQTWKLLKFLPKHFPVGIEAIQAEALIDIDRLNDNPDRARQKANGLINSKYCDDEVSELLTLRAYRYYTDDTPSGIALRNMDYREVLGSFETVVSRTDGHILFAPAQVWTLEELEKTPGLTESDRTYTDTGHFLNDGWVVYSQDGICQGALKFAGAGSETEKEITTKVLSIQWNDQSTKGKDSWSANVIIDPVVIKGSTIKKPSAGSVSKMVSKLISPGAEVTIILANSTIPMIGDAKTPGNGDYQWPTCSCGYQMGVANIFGSLLKCGNTGCSVRLGRMVDYLKGLGQNPIDLNKFLVLDRFKWEQTTVDLGKIGEFFEKRDKDGYKNYLMSFMKTDLQIRNLELVWESSWNSLLLVYGGEQSDCK